MTVSGTVFLNKSIPPHYFTNLFLFYGENPNPPPLFGRIEETLIMKYRFFNSCF